MKKLNVFLSGIMSGIFIGLGVTVYLLCLPNYKIVGSLLFGFGLYCVIVFQTFLYTGKAGAILDNKPSFLLDLLVGLIGNFVGISSLCGLVSLTRVGESVQEKALNLITTKIHDNVFSIFILSIFCGFMIYLAVEGHKKCENPFGRVLICFLAVSVFILCSFEHCVANVGYYVYSKTFNPMFFLYLLVMIIGNATGSVLLDGLFKLIAKTKPNE